MAVTGGVLFFVFFPLLALALVLFALRGYLRVGSATRGGETTERRRECRERHNTSARTGGKDRDDDRTTRCVCVHVSEGD